MIYKTVLQELNFILCKNAAKLMELHIFLFVICMKCFPLDIVIDTNQISIFAMYVMSLLFFCSLGDHVHRNTVCEILSFKIKFNHFNSKLPFSSNIIAYSITFTHIVLSNLLHALCSLIAVLAMSHTYISA